MNFELENKFFTGLVEVMQFSDTVKQANRNTFTYRDIKL